MIKKNPFTKILIKDKKQDIFHSSAYGKAQSGASMGAASTESFARRQEIEQNRQVVRGYKESSVGGGWYNHLPKAESVNKENSQPAARARFSAVAPKPAAGPVQPSVRPQYKPNFKH